MNPVETASVQPPTLTDNDPSPKGQAENAMPGRPRVLILGGGFGGVMAARRLRHACVDVTLLDRGTGHVFQPLLYQVATGLLSEGQITTPHRALLRRQRNARVILGEARTIDPAARRVVAARPDGSNFDVPYDYLVVAVGMRQAYFGHDEFSRHAPGMKTIGDALAIRRRVLGAFEMAESLPTAEERAPWLTFAVTGAGPTGVELAGQIRELATRTIAREYRSIDPREARVLLFDGVDAPLMQFGSQLSAKASRQLTKLGVELHMGVLVTNIDAAGLETKAKDGTVTRYSTRTVLWTAGVHAVPFVDELAARLGAEQDRGGRILVNPDLTVPDHDNIWIVGDVMALNGLPGVAEVALQGGLHAGREIRGRVAKRPRSRRDFRYRDLGSAAYISRFHALVEAGPVKLSGFLGWIVWGVLHLTFLAGARNRAGAAITWLLALGRGKRRERAIPFSDPRGTQDSFTAPVRDA